MQSLTNTDDYSGVLSIETAILVESIELPEITDPEEFPLNYETLFNWHEEDPSKEYILPYNVYTDVVGAFYIPIMFPLVESGEPTELEFDAMSNSNIINGTLEGVNYISKNYITLNIPKYIVMNFYKIIPAGTKFLIGFVGGSGEVSNMSIIGLADNYLEGVEMEESSEEESVEEKISNIKTTNNGLKKK